jgi:hypothetical protein
MKRLARMWGAAALAVAVVVPLSARAQARGRTDGAEGSEYGKGGYSGSVDSRFSLEVNWGAVIPADVLNARPSGPPMFLGLTASLWGEDWYQLDFSGNYLMDSGRMDVLVGPRFRTSTGFPVSLHAGLKAGALFIPERGTHFGVSPQAGVDVRLPGSRILMGLNYALDLPFGATTAHVTNRFFLNAGYRF